MATQRDTAPLPALTAAHQQHLSMLIDSLSAQGQLPEGDLALLRSLAGDMLRLRSHLPGRIRQALQELDQNEIALNNALAAWREAVRVFGAAFERDQLPAPHLLDPTLLRGVSEQAHELSLAAAELALRAQQRAEMIDRHHG